MDSALGMAVAGFFLAVLIIAGLVDLYHFIASALS